MARTPVIDDIKHTMMALLVLQNETMRVGAESEFLLNKSTPAWE